MLTVAALQELGADTNQGLQRCMNNETFYLRMVEMGLNDKGFGTLPEAIKKGDLHEAFEAAHSLKGVMGNLALTPLYTPIAELTEQLRAGTEMDYAPAVASILEKRDRFLALIG